MSMMKSCTLFLLLCSQSLCLSDASSKPHAIPPGQSPPELPPGSVPPTLGILDHPEEVIEEDAEDKIHITSDASLLERKAETKSKDGKAFEDTGSELADTPGESTHHL